MFNLSSINQVRSQKPCDTPVTYIQYDMAIHDFNRAIVNVSMGLAHYLMVYRLIGNKRFSITKGICNNYKLKAPLVNTRNFGKEVGNRSGKVKIGV